MQIGLGIRYDELIHKKLKIIAAYKSKSLNRLMNDMFNREISDWEREHGEIKIPE
jgi:predicted HicB family RNase H-like nuclease